MRHNIIRKLKRAVQWADHFKNAVSEAGCKRTTLEANSLEFFFLGLLKVEQKHFKEALEDFLKSRAILGQLLEVVGSIEKVHLQERIEQIDNNIRFCKYQLNEFGGKSDELAELKKVLMADQTLSLKLEDLASQVNDEGLGGDSVKKTLFGKTIEIQHAKLIHILKELELIEKSMETTKGSSMDNELEKKNETMMENFTEIFNKYDEAIKICEQNMKMEGISEALQKLWQEICWYFQAQKSQKFLERSWILLNNLLSKFDQQKGYENLFSSRVDYKNVKPQDVVKLCDLSLQIIGQLKDIASDMDASCDKEDLYERFYSYVRGFFVSCYHTSQTNYQYGISLQCQLTKRAETLMADLKKKSSIDASFVGPSYKANMIRLITKLENESKIAKVKAHMTLLEEQEQEFDNLPNILDEMDVEVGKKVEKTVWLT